MTRVISSSSVSSVVSNQTLVSEIEPTTRENGGDLKAGDRWINHKFNQEYIWIIDEFDVGYWQLVTSGTRTYISDTPPDFENINTGDFWWNSSDGKLYIYYDDGGGKQWVSITSGNIGVNVGGP